MLEGVCGMRFPGSGEGLALDVVADAVFDGELVPTEFIAETR